MNNYKNIFFDLDGTITRSDPGVLNSFTYTLEKLGIPVPERKEFLKVMGPPLSYSFETFFNIHGQQEIARAISIYREYYDEKGFFETELYEGISELLRDLSQSGLRLYMATTKAAHAAKGLAEHFGIAEYFTFLSGSDESIGRNTKADVIRHILSHERIGDMSTCLMIGDRRFDAEGAAQCGMDCMGVLYGYGDEAELREAGVKYIAPTVEDIRTALLGK